MKEQRKMRGMGANENLGERRKEKVQPEKGKFIKERRRGEKQVRKLERGSLGRRYGEREREREKLSHRERRRQMRQQGVMCEMKGG